jgi:hypothetical protein
MGEIQKLITPASRHALPDNVQNLNCTCGKKADKCKIWGPYGNALKSDPDMDQQSGYRMLIDSLRSKFGAGHFLSDSSKYLPHLRFLVENVSSLGLNQEDIHVLHLVRDVRGYVNSQKRRRSRNGIMFSASTFLKWYIRNREMENYIRNQHLRSFRFGYDELCMRTEAVMTMICDFLNIGFNESMLEPANATGHLVVGNPMRKSSDTSNRIYYDNRWFVDSVSNHLYTLLPLVHRYNRRMVYGNTIARSLPKT